MNLDDIFDTNPTARKMRRAVKSGKVADKVRELSKKKADGSGGGNYDSGVNMSNDDSPSPDAGMGGSGDFSE